MKKPLAVLLVFSLSVSIILLSIAFAPVRAQGTNVQITLYAGELSNGQYGFGNSASSLTSPGPTLTFHDGDKVTVTVNNVGKLPHSWEINTEKSTSGQVLFNSEINPNTFIDPGKSASVTFTVSDKTGNYYYICPVPGHSDLGMWGNCAIEAAVPEFPAPLMLLFVAIAATAFIVYASKSRLKTKSLQMQ